MTQASRRARRTPTMSRRGMKRCSTRWQPLVARAGRRTTPMMRASSLPPPGTPVRMLAGPLRIHPTRWKLPRCVQGPTGLCMQRFGPLMLHQLNEAMCCIIQRLNPQSSCPIEGTPNVNPFHVTTRRWSLGDQGRRRAHRQGVPRQPGCSDRRCNWGRCRWSSSSLFVPLGDRFMLHVAPLWPPTRKEGTSCRWTHHAPASCSLLVFCRSFWP